MTNLMESKMTESHTSSRMRRYKWSWVVCVLGGVIGGAFLGYAENRTELPMRDNFIILSAILLLGSLCLGAWLYHSSIDEHEKEAVYISNSVGLYCLIAFLFGSVILRMLSDPIMISMRTIIFGGAIPALVVFIWKKYR
jgi:tellurite resistance protein TehA-like permease